MMRRVCSMMVAAFLLGAAASAQSQPVPLPDFEDPARRAKLAAAFPEVERLLAAWAARVHAPGAAMGLIIDGELAWVKTVGAREPEGAEVTPDTVFRIASMTKSFTALAILKLRDEEKLSLDDPVSRYVPELAGLPRASADAPAITIRHLLTHSGGFPEDNPWGDQQLAQPQVYMSAWMRAGIPFSTVTGTAYEYSNYGFAILGQVIERVSKQPYDEYMRVHIFEPLGLKDTTFHADRVPADRRARGYRWEDAAWKEEPPLAHGTFGAMGGLWTSTRDLARYVAFQLAAWPPRDAPETGPVRRSSVREMQQAWRAIPARASRQAVGAPLELVVPAYGYGLRIAQTCTFPYTVSHGGGLPGYGSLMMWRPEHGIGLIGMANVTYAGWGRLFNEALAALSATGALRPRVVRPSPALVAAKTDVSRLIAAWDDGLARRIAADNLFRDASAERRRARFEALAAAHGRCTPDAGLEAENALRGTWRLSCERGRIDVGITLTPTEPPLVQSLDVRGVMPPGAAMQAALRDAAPRIAKEAAAWGACTLGEPAFGDGTTVSGIELSCERGSLLARLTLDPGTGKLKDLTLQPAGGMACVP